jgi:hypothetical protein
MRREARTHACSRTNTPVDAEGRVHMCDFHPCFRFANIHRNEEACEGMRKLTIKVGPGIASSYKVPGQYTKARANAQQVA